MTVEMRVVIGGMKKLKIFLVKKIDTRQENNTSSKFYFIPQRVNPVLFVSHTKIRKNFSRKTSFKFFLVSWFIAFFFYSFFFSVPYPLQVLKKKKVRIVEKIQSLRFEIRRNWLKQVLYLHTMRTFSGVSFGFFVALACVRKENWLN